jgi:hypothetical protein
MYLFTLSIQHLGVAWAAIFPRDRAGADLAGRPGPCLVSLQPRCKLGFYLAQRQRYVCEWSVAPTHFNHSLNGRFWREAVVVDVSLPPANST